MLAEHKADVNYRLPDLSELGYYATQTLRLGKGRQRWFVMAVTLGWMESATGARFAEACVFAQGLGLLDDFSAV